MRRNGPPRLNRLPQRLDYTLIPAPLDLSLPLVDEKSPLPAIIVTPSSPSGETDFSIAFLAAAPKPTVGERLSSLLPTLPSLRSRLPSQIQLPQTPQDFPKSGSSWLMKSRTRTSILFLVLLFIMACHLILARIITSHPRLNFAVPSDNIANLHAVATPAKFGTYSGASKDEHSSPPSVGGWLDLRAIWAPVPNIDTDGRRSMRFIVTDTEPKSTTS